MNLFETSYKILGISSFMYVYFIYLSIFIILYYLKSIRKITSIINMFIYNINDSNLTTRSYAYILFFAFYSVVILNMIGLSGLSMILANPINTLILCAFICGWIIIQGIRKFGIMKFLYNLVPAGTPKSLFILMFLIELLTLIIRPIILAFRICLVNAIGHMILHVFEGILGGQKWVLFVMLLLDIIKSLLQGYLFTLSLSLFMKTCTEDH